MKISCVSRGEDDGGVNMRKRGASANDSGIRPNLTNFFLKNRQPEFARGRGSFARTVALKPPQGHPRPARAQSSFSPKVRNRQSALILRKRQPSRSCALGLIGPARPALGQFTRANMSDDERLIVREISSRRVNIRARSAWKDFQERPTTHSFGAGADSVSASFSASAGVIVNPGATERVARSERNQRLHFTYGASSSQRGERLRRRLAIFPRLRCRSRTGGLRSAFFQRR